MTVKIKKQPIVISSTTQMPTSMLLIRAKFEGDGIKPEGNETFI